MNQGNPLYPQPSNTSQSAPWQGQNSPNVATPQQSPIPSTYVPQYSQAASVAAAPMYTSPAASPVYNPYSQPPKQGKIAVAVLASVLAIAAAVAAALGTLLPFLTRRSSLSLVHANGGAGLSVILVAMLAVVFVSLAAFSGRKNTKAARIFALLGGLGGIFLIIFTLANLFGADANHIIDIGGSRGVGGPIIIIGGAVMIVSALLAMLAVPSASSAKTASPQYQQPQYQQPQYPQQF